ncbi:alpha-glucoside-specific PTS transporter subunit IIBC [Carnobacteriaceae bacterium zg-ZUI252]|nr:alpha-glucoside-specific PTS transporter subunit IIBC [Carnobacteriaceae bacterium zg-ZUI252]
MMKKIQRFGGAMFTPTLLFAFAGIMAGLSIVMTNKNIFGGLADPNTLWSQIWNIIGAGSWTVFLQLPLLFALALPIALAKKQQARACLEALATYLTFNYFVNAMLTTWGSTFGVDMTKEASTGSGLTMIASIKTLDTGMVGALVVSGIVVWLHNRYFDKELPELMSIFRGSSLIVAMGFFAMLPLAYVTCLVWPQVQLGMKGLQSFFINSGSIGIWFYGFLQKILIPTGLHHFIYAPFVYDNVIVQGGTSVYWATHLQEFATNAATLKDLYPIGFSLSGLSKVFGSVGIFGAFYVTSKPEKRKKLLGLLVPAALTAILIGVTEPLEFTFLFVAPVLFGIHAVLDATMQALAFSFGVVGDFGGGLINWVFMNWLPLGFYHYATYITQVIIGIIFAVIYFFVFTFLIKKLNLKTPGREDDEEVKFYSKQEYNERKEGKAAQEVSMDRSTNTTAQQAAAYLDLLGGKDNIVDVTNCATRLRVTVKDGALVAADSQFKEAGAAGLMHNDTAVQVIVGLNVPYVRDEFEALLD